MDGFSPTSAAALEKPGKRQCRSPDDADAPQRVSPRHGTGITWRQRHAGYLSQRSVKFELRRLFHVYRRFAGLAHRASGNAEARACYSPTLRLRHERTRHALLNIRKLHSAIYLFRRFISRLQCRRQISILPTAETRYGCPKHRHFDLPKATPLYI